MFHIDVSTSTRTFTYRGIEVTVGEDLDTGGWSYAFNDARGVPFTGREYGAHDIAEVAGRIRVDRVLAGLFEVFGTCSLPSLEMH